MEAHGKSVAHHVWTLSRKDLRTRLLVELREKMTWRKKSWEVYIRIDLQSSEAKLNSCVQTFPILLIRSAFVSLRSQICQKESQYQWSQDPLPSLIILTNLTQAWPELLINTLIGIPSSTWVVSTLFIFLLYRVRWFLCHVNFNFNQRQQASDSNRIIRSQTTK